MFDGLLLEAAGPREIRETRVSQSPPADGRGLNIIRSVRI